MKFVMALLCSIAVATGCSERQSKKKIVNCKVTERVDTSSGSCVAKTSDNQTVKKCTALGQVPDPSNPGQCKEKTTTRDPADPLAGVDISPSIEQAEKKETGEDEEQEDTDSEDKVAGSEEDSTSEDDVDAEKESESVVTAEETSETPAVIFGLRRLTPEAPLEKANPILAVVSIEPHEGIEKVQYSYAENTIEIAADNVLQLPWFTVSVAFEYKGQICSTSPFDLVPQTHLNKTAGAEVECLPKEIEVSP